MNQPTPSIPSPHVSRARDPHPSEGLLPRVFGIAFTPQTEAELAGELIRCEVQGDGTARLVVTANVAHIVELQRNAEFRAAYRSAWRSTADGTPVFLYARARGVHLPGRLTGSGLFAELMPLLDPEVHRCFFVAPSQEALDGCSAYLRERGFSAERVGGVVPPRGFDQDAAYSADLVRRIREARTTHLFLGVGAPKSEIWVHRNAAELGPAYVLCIGAGLEFFCGIKSRGPAWARAMGLEWLWRLLQEPRRLARRYLLESWSFFGAVRDDLRGRSVIDEAN
ncbi:WecB/TagA/CpsF family glycosyltransferase [Alsobacter sp. R-9]